MATSRPILSRAIRNAGLLVRSATEWGDSSIPPNSAGTSLRDMAGVGGGAIALAAVMSCIKVLSDDFRALPFRAYKGDPLGAKSVAPIQPQIVAEPFGPDLDPAAGMAQLVTSYVSRGNAFGFYTQFDGMGFPLQMMVLHPDRVTPFWDKDGRKRFRVGYDEVYDSSRIFHVAGFMMPGAAAGVDILTLQRFTFYAMQAVEQYGSDYFDNGGDPAGVITSPNQVNHEKAKFIRDQWVSARQSGGNLPAVLPNGATWQQVSVTPENAQFLETRRFNRETVCGIFGVPLQRIQAIVENASQGGGKGVDAIDHGYQTHTLLPIASGFESAWDRLIPGGLGTWTGFDWDAILRAAARERAEIAQIHRTIGVRPSNEIRAGEGWTPLRGPDGELDPRGDDAFQPINSNIGSTDPGLPGAAPTTIPAAPDQEVDPNAA